MSKAVLKFFWEVFHAPFCRPQIEARVIRSIECGLVERLGPIALYLPSQVVVLL